MSCSALFSESLSLNLELTGSAPLADQQILRSLLSASPVLDSKQIYLGTGDLNMGPLSCKASALLVNPSS